MEIKISWPWRIIKTGVSCATNTPISQVEVSYEQPDFRADALSIIEDLEWRAGEEPDIIAPEICPDAKARFDDCNAARERARAFLKKWKAAQ